MSKKKEEKKDAPPLDYQTEMKMLSFTVTLKDKEISDLIDRNKALTLSIANLEKENADLKAAYIQSFKTEKTIRQMQELLDHSDREYEKLKEEKRQQEREFQEEKETIKRQNEIEINKLKLTLDSYQKKIESVNSLQQIVEKQEEQIKQLDLEKDKLRIEADERIKNKEIRNQIKFSDLKSKMLENIEETKKNVTQLNIEYMDVSTKLTLLQNHQLLIELEYQSQQIEELLRKKENLEKKVFELGKDIEVHKEVELALAAKNKKYSEIVKILERNQENYENNNNNNNINSLHNSTEIPPVRNIQVNSHIKEFFTVGNLEKKISKLEIALKKKQEDYLKIKNNFEIIDEKLKNYEKKYAGVFFLFEEGLKRFYEDEEVKNNRDIFINLENVKKGEFSNFTNQEKYSIIVLLMKYLIPLINPSELKNSEIGMNGVENIRVKYHMSKKIMDDPLLKKVFSNYKGNNSVQQVRRSLENLPTINNIGVSSTRKINSNGIGGKII